MSTRRPAANFPRPTALLALLALLGLLAVLGTGACRASNPDQEAGTEPAAGTEAAAPAPATPSGATASLPAGPAGDERAAESQGSRRPQRPTDLPADRPLRAGFLVVDGVYNSELMAPYDVLHHTVFHTAPRPGVEVFTVSPDGQPVTTFEGIRLTPHYSFANAPAIDILVVPSAKGSMDADLENAQMIDWVRRVGSEARYVMSLCDGAFVLARAGLLQGHAATTFPDDYERFSQMFPGVDLRINVSFVQDGKFLTSQGGAKSYAVAMHLIDWLYGEKVAQGVGHGLLLPWPQPPSSEPHVVEADPVFPETGAEPAPGGAAGQDGPPGAARTPAAPPASPPGGGAPP